MQFVKKLKKIYLVLRCGDNAFRDFRYAAYFIENPLELCSDLCYIL